MYLLFMSTRREHFDSGGDMLFAKKVTLTEAKESAIEEFKERHPYGTPYQFARITSDDGTDLIKYRGGGWRQMSHDCCCIKVTGLWQNSIGMTGSLERK